MSMVIIDAVELEIGYNLIGIIDDNSQDNLLKRITSIRKQLMSELGLVLPVVRIRDNLNLPAQTYRIKIRGQEVASSELLLDRLLAIPGSDSDNSLRGTPTTEPAFGLPALWITEHDRSMAEIKGYTVVNPLSVLTTHLTEIIRSNASELLSRQMVQEMLNQLRQKSPASVEGVVPEMFTLGDVQNVLRNLLRERIPVRDLSGILEVLANHGGQTRDPNILSEAVRQTMAITISSQYKDEQNVLHVFTLSPHLEGRLRGMLTPSDGGPGFGIDANTAQQILAHTGEQMENMAGQGYMPVLLLPRELRLAFRRLSDRSLPGLVVLAYSEVGTGIRVKTHGMVNVE
jgi:flagellar biosynthesis protein FlhA